MAVRLGSEVVLARQPWSPGACLHLQATTPAWECSIFRVFRDEYNKMLLRNWTYIAIQLEKIIKSVNALRIA